MRCDGGCGRGGDGADGGGDGGGRAATAATAATVATVAAIIDPSPHTRMSMGSSGPNRGHHHSREAVIMPKKGGWVEGA